jgi:broad specificity phosphatase PhoE
VGQVLLVRHGQASWGAADYDVLSPLGERQAVATGTFLAGVRPDAVVHGLANVSLRPSGAARPRNKQA